MTTLEQILAWTEGLPAWQSDAVRRLLTQEELSEKDKAEVFALIKKQHGIHDPEKPALEAVSLQSKHLPVPTARTGQMILKRLKEIENVNALMPGQELQVGHEGLTVVYGENGSGKSGYARVLKRACRARDEKEKIHPNVFGSGSAGPPKATFVVSIDGTDKEIVWVGPDAPEELSDVVVFDAKCARIIVNENNEPTYLPYGAGVFGDLGILLQWLKERLEAEKPRPVPPTVLEMPTDTIASRFLDVVAMAPDQSTLEKAAVWTAADEQELVALTKRLTVAQSDEASQRVRGLRRLANDTRNMGKAMQLMLPTISPGKQEELKTGVDRMQALAVASASLAEDLAKEPVKGAGTKTWQELYLAAKKYSTTEAYPGASFPVMGDETHCVFCMQPLSSESKDRLLRFRNFMESELKQQQEEVGRQIRAILGTIERTEFDPLKIRPELLEEVKVHEPSLAAKTMSWLKAAQERAGVETRK